VSPLPDVQGQSLLSRILGRGGEASEYVCSHTVHEHQRDGGTPQFDHYAIQTLQYKFIRLELHANPTALHSNWKQRFQTIMLRAGRNPSELAAGTVIRELYDLCKDPGEHRSLLNTGGGPPDWRNKVSEQHRAIADDLEAKLDRWIEKTQHCLD